MGISRISNNASEIKRRLDARREHGMKAIFTNDEGAIDLASIMVGVLVIGIIAGVIAATVFAVIPWSQNNAAKQALGAVNTAESVQYAQSAGAGAAVYGDTLGTVNLTTSANASKAPLLQSSKKVEILLATGNQAYVAVSASDTGDLYFSFSDNPSTVLDAADAATKLSDDATGAKVFTGVTLPTSFDASTGAFS